MKKYLADKFARALAAMGHRSVRVTFEKPKLEAHGDVTTNVAMTLAKAAGQNPRELAQEIVRNLKLESDAVEAVEIAGPGFINIRFAGTFFTSRLASILREAEKFGRSESGGGKKTQVEFVSANPTGPLSVGHGRQAALGDTLANFLDWTGHNVTREYYYNNAGRQMRKLAESVYARYRRQFEPEFPLPEGAYEGEYIGEIAGELRKIHNATLATMATEEALKVCGTFAEQSLFGEIKAVLKRMGVVHDVYYNEDSLYTDGKIREVVEEFRRRDLAYDKDGAVWLRTSALGLEQDRVIVKSTGEPTYRLPDIAYHREKFRRGFELIVDVFGADHIATIPDVLAGIKALGYDAGKVKVVIHQFVTLLRNGQQVKMSKRTANFVTLAELIDDVGADATRFFFLMRATTTHLEFDLNLAKEQSESNPVYYLQYAHARIASILRFAESEGRMNGQTEDVFKNLREPSEVALAKVLLEFPETVENACAAFEPHRLTGYLHDVATAFHRFYHEHRVLVPDASLASARLMLCRATGIVLANGFKILGISAPEKM